MLWLFIGIASLGFIMASFLAANENPNEKESYFPIDGEEKSIIDRFVKKMGLPESDFSFIPPLFFSICRKHAHLSRTNAKKCRIDR
jgi:hypothetical protein